LLRLFFRQGSNGAGLDIILVGDSLANVVLGLEDIKRISISEMINHTKAVSLATPEFNRGGYALCELSEKP
jgi:ketopantoate hydroxymethyltransferase